MIEKITNQNQIARHKLAEKINELVDATNKLRIDLNNHTCRLMALENKDNQVADTFAEQCKWRGKLCKFWDSENTEDCTYGILRNVFDIYNYDCPFQCEDGEWYEYCEPVKPDSDVIYKGE